MKKSKMDEDLEYSRYKMEKSMIQAARLKHLGYYLDDEGCRHIPCYSEVQNHIKYYLQMAEYEAKQILFILTSMEFEPSKVSLEKEPK